MPELPEVETVVRQLRTHYLHRTISKVEARPCRIFQNVTAAEFARALQGKKIQAIKRYGKFFYWEAEEVYPLFHLGMSGIFIRDRSASRYPQHIHLSFFFESGLALFFQDVRKFSKIYLYQKPPDFGHLGLDPVTKNFTLNKLKKLLNLKSMNLKSFLMDQKIIAGIGNIYASEILFDAGISPLRRSNRLSGREAERLFHSIRRILNLAIERFGTTYSAYRTVEGESGQNQRFLKVYHRAGEPCVKCGNPILKIVQNNRSTFYCPHCQR